MTESVEGGQLRSQLVELGTGEVVEESSSLSGSTSSWGGSTRWLPDSSAVVYADRGATLRLLGIDGTSTDLGLPADSFSSVVVGP